MAAQRLRELAARTAGSAVAYATVPLVAIGIASATGLLGRLPDGPRTVVSLAVLPALAVFVLGLLAQWTVPRPEPSEPLPLRSPVRGRWRAMNSPATKVPSHGTHAYGQTFAIDVVHEPTSDARPRFGGRTSMRAPEAYPAFGEPVLAPIAGRVVTARDRRRDHRARSNLLGYLYMLVEGVAFSLLGAAGVIGNRVVLEVSADGPFVVLAHLQRGSLRVAEGDRVEAGQVLARVGNTGNSSEPHVHMHVMDRANPSRALGVPFTFTDVVVADEVVPPDASAPSPVVPANDEVFHGGAEHPSPRR